MSNPPPGPHPIPTPGVTSPHSSHTSPGRGSRHPSHSTSKPRQPHHAAPDCSRAHSGDLWTGRIRGVRAGCAEPSPRRPGERTRCHECGADAADLGSRARDRRRADDRVARAGGTAARLHLPRRTPLRRSSRREELGVDGGVSVPIPTFRALPPATPTPSPTAKPSTSPSPTPKPHPGAHSHSHARATLIGLRAEEGNATCGIL